MVAQRNQEICKAVVKLSELSADEKACDLYERREKERRDTAMFLRDAERQDAQQGQKPRQKQAQIDIAKNAIQMNMDTSSIIKLTGLAYEEVEILYQ